MQSWQMLLSSTTEPSPGSSSRQLQQQHNSALPLVQLIVDVAGACIPHIALIEAVISLLTVHSSSSGMGSRLRCWL
jgi:hypothetical protein